MSSTAPGRRAPAELIERLHALIDKLLAENQRLKRQLEKRTGVASGKVERGLRTMKRRVEKALSAKRPKKRTPAKRSAKAKPAKRVARPKKKSR